MAQSADYDAPSADGYDWLMNRCVDIEQADHATHLDDGRVVGGCSYCQSGEGRTRVTPPASPVADPVENDARWGLTWVGGVLRYDTQEEAESKQRAFGSGSVIPPAEKGGA